MEEEGEDKTPIETFLDVSEIENKFFHASYSFEDFNFHTSLIEMVEAEYGRFAFVNISRVNHVAYDRPVVARISTSSRRNSCFTAKSPFQLSKKD